MVLIYIIASIFFPAFLILWAGRSTFSKSKIKFARHGNSEINYKRTERNENKYVTIGLGAILKVGLISFLYPRKKSDSSSSSGTVYDKFYSLFGSPKSKISKATFIIKFLRSTLIYPIQFKTVKAFLCNDSCTDRFPKNITEHYSQGRGKGILFNSGEEAKELRRYAMKTLGQLGFGKNHKMSEILNEQLADLLENLENQIISTNNKIQVRNLFTNSAISIVWSIIGGEKFAHNDPTLLFLYENVERLASLNLISVLPTDFLSHRALYWLDIFGFEYRKFYAALENLTNYFHNYIEEKKFRLVETDPVDFIDYFLLEIEKHRLDDQLNKIYCKDQLAYVLLDLFAAGMDTTSKYMEGAFMFLALNPDVQVKVQQEIDSVIGNGLPFYPTHRKRMPFTEATIMEIHRMANIVPAMPRMTNKSLDIDGQHFEKGTFILANFFYFRKDESYWGDPKVFRPQRFLDGENNLIVDKINHVMPFGAGPRACLGESAATASIFVLLTGILQRYSVTQGDLNESLGLDKSFVAVSHPEPFHVSLVHRNT